MVEKYILALNIIGQQEGIFGRKLKEFIQKVPLSKNREVNGIRYDELIKEIQGVGEAKQRLKVH